MFKLVCNLCVSAFFCFRKEIVMKKMSEEAKAKRAEYCREWRKKNPEKAKECAKRWRDKNRATENARRRQWARNHPEKVTEYNKTAYENGSIARYWEKKAAAMHTQSDDPNTSDATTDQSKSE